MPEFHASESGEHEAEAGNAREQQWDAVLPGTCVLLNSLCHRFSGDGNRQRVTYTDVAGRRWTTKAHGLTLSAWYMSENPEQVWVTFDPACPADQAGTGERPGEAS